MSCLGSLSSSLLSVHTPQLGKLPNKPCLSPSENGLSYVQCMSVEKTIGARHMHCLRLLQLGCLQQGLALCFERILDLYYIHALTKNDSEIAGADTDNAMMDRDHDSTKCALLVVSCHRSQ